MKIILSVIGKDRPGIIAGVSHQLYELNLNILDVSQTIMDEYFTMIMLIDQGCAVASIDEIKQQLSQTGQQLGVQIHIQREEIFDAMHRL